jgi:hypothetical protein
MSKLSLYSSIDKEHLAIASDSDEIVISVEAYRPT